MEEIGPVRMTTARAPFPPATVLSPPSASEPRPPGWLTADDLDALSALRQRDQEVRSDECDRLEDAGVWQRPGVDYEYRVGPDNRRYAVDAHPGMVAALAPAKEDAKPSPPAPGKLLDLSA
jgi:hypothetical protein